MTNILGRNPGISVASLDYLSNIHNSLSSPILIEEEKSDFIAETTTKDGLTQLYIRSLFDVTLEKELEKNVRNHKNLSLLMIDIDDFKQINDNYGHQKGDEVLRKIGELINNNIRKMDFAAIYGGEELAIIAPESTLNETLLIAERIRKKVSLLKFSNFSISVSIGISQTNSNIKAMTDLIKTADEALYNAKRSGKNKVVVYKDY